MTPISRICWTKNVFFAGNVLEIKRTCIKNSNAFHSISNDSNSFHHYSVFKLTYGLKFWFISYEYLCATKYTTMKSHDFTKSAHWTVETVTIQTGPVFINNRGLRLVRNFRYCQLCIIWKIVKFNPKKPVLSQIPMSFCHFLWTLANWFESLFQPALHHLR